MPKLHKENTIKSNRKGVSTSSCLGPALLLDATSGVWSPKLSGLGELRFTPQIKPTCCGQKRNQARLPIDRMLPLYDPAPLVKFLHLSSLFYPLPDLTNYMAQNGWFPNRKSGRISGNPEFPGGNGATLKLLTWYCLTPSTSTRKLRESGSFLCAVI